MLARSSTLKGSLNKDMPLPTRGARGASITLRQRKKMSSFACMDSVNMQNGISESTIGTQKIQNEDTNFPMAISRMFIAVGCSLLRAGQANMSITILKMQRPN
jgi:hypothetical protein